MKIQTNYVISTRRYSLLLSCLFLFVAAFLVLAALLEWQQASRAIQEIPKLKEQILRLNKIAETNSKNTLPNRAQMEITRQGIRSLAAITNIQIRQPGQLLSRLERIIPPNVVLRSIRYRAGNNRVKLLAESGDAGKLTAFLIQLEKQTDFRDVVLHKQSRKQEKGRSRVQFEIGLMVLS